MVGLRGEIRGVWFELQGKLRGLKRKVCISNCSIESA